MDVRPRRFDNGLFGDVSALERFGDMELKNEFEWNLSKMADNPVW